MSQLRPTKNTLPDGSIEEIEGEEDVVVQFDGVLVDADLLKEKVASAKFFVSRT